MCVCVCVHIHQSRRAVGALWAPALYWSRRPARPPPGVGGAGEGISGVRGGLPDTWDPAERRDLFVYRSHVGAGHGRLGRRSKIREERRRGGASAQCSIMACLADNGTFLQRLQDTDLGQRGGVADVTNTERRRQKRRHLRGRPLGRRGARRPGEGQAGPGLRRNSVT